jgi:tRNA pseudouridine55 synthase
MARRRRGRDVSGWLVIDKPAGPSSAAVVARVRRALDARKAGHAGTLDPLATGLLAVALGEATKTVPHIADAAKSYRFTARLGVATETDDAEGAAVASSEARPTDAEVEAALPALTGDILQVPPAYSAVKVEGRRAYAVARAGGTAALEPRPLRVHALRLVERPDPDRAVLEMTCGKGGYVRSVARDLGRALGCHAHVETLRRTATGPWTEAQAVTLDALEEAPPEERDRLLRPVADALRGLPELRCRPGAAERLRRGQPGEVLGTAEWGQTAWASRDGEPVALGVHRAGHLHPTRVFAAPTPGEGG